MAAAPPTTLLLVLSAPMAFYLISSAAPFTPAANGPLPAGLGPGVFCPDFSLAAGGEKARLFRISMTMACNAVTGVGGKIPGQQQRQQGEQAAGWIIKILFNHED